MVTIHIINTGRELMLGLRLNTHQQWLCRELSRHGYGVSRQVAVDDSPAAIKEAVHESLQTADLVITTGGLGPTTDDRTRDVIAELVDRPLHQSETVLNHIRNIFARRNRKYPARIEVQAQVPEGAEILLNAHGTAPGLAMEAPRDSSGLSPAWLVMLPGPPRELHPMFQKQVLPLLKSKFPLPSSVASSVLRSTGLGESWVEQKVGPALMPYTEAGLEVGYCARPSEVDIQLLARGTDAKQTVAKAEEIVLSLIGKSIFGSDEDQLEEIVIRCLKDKGLTLAVAESCTGGLIANRLTDVPGASEVLLAGVVTYSNTAKESFLGVSANTLREHGAVSAAVAKEMAEGMRKRTGADFAVSVTGIAGPSGGTEDKPVGTVFTGLASAQGTETQHRLNPFDRATFKYVTSQQILEQLRRTVLGVKE